MKLKNFILLLLSSLLLITIISATKNNYQTIILEESGTSKEINGTIKLSIYKDKDSSLPLIKAERTFFNGTWNIRIDVSNLKPDNLYWKDYQINNIDVKWGPLNRDKKPLFFTNNSLLKDIGEWLWELQLVVDGINKRLNDLSFIQPYKDGYMLNSKLYFKDGNAVSSIAVNDPSNNSKETLATQLFVENIFNKTPKTFLNLTDTPNSYSGYGGYFIRVKEDESGLEFVKPPKQKSSSTTIIEGSNISFPKGELIYGTGSSINSSPYLVFDNQTNSLAINKNLSSLSGNYNLEVNGYINATPICVKLNVVEDYQIQSEILGEENIPIRSFRKEFETYPNFYGFKDTDAMPGTDALSVNESGVYQITFKGLLHNKNSLAPVGITINGRLYSYVYANTLIKPLKDHHYVEINEIVKLKKGDAIGITSINPSRFKAYDPKPPSGGKGYYITSLTICKLN